MRSFLKFIRRIIFLGLIILVIFLFFRSNKKKVLVIGSSQRLGSIYHQMANDYNYELHIYGGDKAYIDQDNMRDIIRKVDGIIFAGGRDFDPALYGSNGYDLVEDYSTIEDENDLKLLEIAIEEKKPILGICRGMQLINIYYGGSLYEDLPSQFGTDISHRAGNDDFTYHMVNFNEYSRLYDKLNGEISRKVNSMHHQGIKDLGDGLIETATSDDGLIEAIENPYYDSYMVGLQWHPEYSQGQLDSLSKVIFDDFTKAMK